MPFRRITFLGFGLIGGSIAMALRAQAREDRESGAKPAAEIGATQPAGGLHLTAWTPSGHGSSEGLARGILDAAPRDAKAALDGADLVVLAGPPLAILEQLDELGGLRRAALGRALVTDVASTKVSVVERATRHGLRFVGGHPMAGRETSGVEAASAALFGGKPWAIVAPDGAREIDVAAVAALAVATGASPVRLSAADHDAAVAAISHLPLLASVALVEAVAADPVWLEGAGRELASSGWRDMTRLASGSAAMGAGILASNAAEVVPRLRALRDALDTWITELERTGGPDATQLQRRLEAARASLAAEPTPRPPRSPGAGA